MTINQDEFVLQAFSYLERIRNCFSPEVLKAVEILADSLMEAWVEGRQVFICGNGGSAANAIHLANDLHYGIGACGSLPLLPGLRVEALPANSGIITCLANDTGYANIYSHQLQVKGSEGDILIVLSGSGNSENIVKALETAHQLKIKTFAIIAFSGGKCLKKAEVPIYCKVEDMQAAEDAQLIIGHLCMQWLSSNKPAKLEKTKKVNAYHDSKLEFHSKEAQ